MKTAERFIKKQVTVEAIQFNGNSNKGDIELFVGKELKAELESETAYVAGQGAPIFSLLIETKEGVMKAFKNDWIIKEPFPTGDRDFYPCKPDIFGKTYLPYASHPSPVMSAEEIENNLMRYGSDEPDEYRAWHLGIIDGLSAGQKLNVMSAEQVCRWVKASERLPEIGITVLVKYFDTYQELYYKNNVWFVKGTNLVAYSECFSLQLEWLETLSTTPSVKADGWVSVEDELPKVGQKVDLWLVPDDEEKSYRMTWTWEKESTARITINGCKVTHWQPFTPPKQHLQTITSK